MRTTLFLLLLLTFSFTASAQEDASDYNNMIVDEQTKIGNRIVDFSNAESNEDMQLAHKILLQQIDESLSVIEKLGAWQGDGALQNSSIQLFNFYKSIASIEYKEIMEMLNKDQLSEEEISHYDVIQTNITSREEKLDADFAFRQEEFAKRWGFTLE